VAATGLEARAELETLGELTGRAWARDVQLMIEGPGHLPIDQLESNARRHQRPATRRPSTRSGRSSPTSHPATTTHLGDRRRDRRLARALPDAGDVKQGLIAYRIAAHAADLARGSKRAAAWDRALSRARFAFDWRRQFKTAEFCLDVRSEALPDAQLQGRLLGDDPGSRGRAQARRAKRLARDDSRRAPLGAHSARRRPRRVRASRSRRESGDRCRKSRRPRAE
jgi:Radical SAM ThiC family